MVVWALLGPVSVSVAGADAPAPGAVQAPTPATTNPVTSLTTAEQSFQLAYALQRFGRLGQRYTYGVEGLRQVANDGAAAAKMVGIVDADGQTLRRDEAACLTEAQALLAALQAPAGVAGWDASALKTLAGKPAKAPEATPDDSVAVHDVLAIIDETDALDQGAEAEAPTLIASIKLRGGADSLWAFDAGRLSADIDFAEGSGGSGPAAAIDPDFVKRLVLSAPADTLQPVMDALDTLRPPPASTPEPAGQPMNLSALRPGQEPEIPADALVSAQKILLAAYGAQGIHDRLAGGASPGG
jgi:hypothetical protein